jgi:hypothetical protein
MRTVAGCVLCCSAYSGFNLMGNCLAGNACGGGGDPLPPPRHDALLLTAISLPGGLT